MIAKCVKYARIITAENILQVYIFTVSSTVLLLLINMVCTTVRNIPDHSHPVPGMISYQKHFRLWQGVKLATREGFVV